AVRSALRRDRSQLALTVGAAVAAAAIVLLSGVVLGIAQVQRPPSIKTASALALAVAAGVAALRLGPRLAILAALAVSVVLSLLPGGSSTWGEDVGARCLVAELIAAAVVMGPALWLADRRGWPVNATLLAAVAAAGGLSGQAMLTLLCPVGPVSAHL